MDDSQKDRYGKTFLGVGSGATLGVAVGGPVGAAIGGIVGGILGATCSRSSNKQKRIDQY
jgi:outer membrane lipoprotein SlyB